jgi:hypothetical protein
MVYWLVGGLISVSDIETHSDAERVGAAIGTTLGVSMIIGLWVAGDIILGIFVLLTRGTKVIISEAADGRPPRSFGSDSTNDESVSTNADQMIARYLQNQSRAEANVLPSRPVRSPAVGFGRRQA